MISDSNDKSFNNSFYYNQYFENIESQMNNQMNNQIKDILIISDSMILMELFKIRNNLSKKYNFFYTNNIKSNNSVGLHKNNILDKKKLNEELITDFYLFSKANIKIFDNISLFSKMANRVTFYQ